MEPKHRILIAESGSGYGGTAKYLAGLLPLLDRERFAIEIVAYGKGPFVQRVVKEGWSIRFHEDWRFPFLNRIPRIASWLRKEKIELVHLNNEIRSHVPLILAARWAGSKVLCHLHGWRKLTRIERWTSRFVDQFVAVTTSGAHFYQKQLNREVKGVPNGIAASGLASVEGMDRTAVREALGLGKEDFLAVLIGRLVPLKGHSVFFKALARARKVQSGLRGLVVGNDPSDGGYRRRLEEELSRLGLEKTVRFVPWQESLDAVYEASDVVVQPSVQPESFGYVALEGMLAGKPVVAARSGGLADLVLDGETGILVEPGSANELASAVTRIAEDPAYATELGQRGRERALSVFNMERNAKQIQEIYGNLLR